MNVIKFLIPVIFLINYPSASAPVPFNYTLRSTGVVLKLEHNTHARAYTYALHNATRRLYTYLYNDVLFAETARSLARSVINRLVNRSWRACALPANCAVMSPAVRSIFVSVANSLDGVTCIQVVLAARPPAGRWDFAIWKLKLFLREYRSERYIVVFESYRRKL